MAGWWPTACRRMPWLYAWTPTVPGVPARALRSVGRGSRTRSGTRRTRRSVGKRNYLMEGVSGTGKTTVCNELQRRGYQAVRGDRELAYQGDPQTGEPVNR